MESAEEIAQEQAPEGGPRPLMNKAEAAAYLRISVRFVERLVHCRRIQFARIGSRLIFKRSELDRYVDVLTAMSA